MRNVTNVIIAIITGTMLCQLLVASMVYAAPKDDGIKLYNEKRYAEARLAFEQNRRSTMLNPDAYYYYALTLNSLGKPQEAIAAWAAILRRYPKSQAAGLSKTALARWSPKPAVPNKDFGILGFKYQTSANREASIREVFPGTPAVAANIQRGDRILAVDGVTTLNLDKDQVYRLLVGRPETTVKLTMGRGAATLDVSLKRMASIQFSKAHPDLWKNYVLMW